MWEETGYRVEVTDLPGIFDSRHCDSRTGQQLYHILVTGKVIGDEAATSNETFAVRWFAPDEIPWVNLSPGHEPRIRSAQSWRDSSNPRPFLDQEAWSPQTD